MDINNIKISGHHIEITEALETYIKNIVTKLHQKFNHITNIHVILKIDSSVHPHLQQAEAELSLSGKQELVFAKANSIDMYNALHQLKNKLERQIVKHKEIQANHHHHNNNHNNNQNSSNYLYENNSNID